ncbi:MAG: LuxR C-terminal-related transcriptional regulator [Bacteroides sp.]|nr:LuxR C-terminal-related transcriptional regulator [Ruminococcus flavefaciens]MCM1554719.1 LuxR C-terminal-related transcriptional regulator [Bacteroides sp.]
MDRESQKNYVNMVMELSESRSQLAERSLRLKNKQMVILAVTSLSVIVTVLLLWLVAVERRRRSRQTLLLKEIERQELAGQLENEKRISLLQKEKTEQKIRELTSYTLLLSNKNNVLRAVKETALKAGAEKDESGFDKIKRLVDSNLNMDNDYWEQFVAHFTQVAPHFFDNLKQTCPHLTPNEIKLCAYIRIGLSSKQIAQLLNLSQESVNKNRYRLRKKLNLEKEVDLDDLIAGL